MSQPVSEERKKLISSLDERSIGAFSSFSHWLEEHFSLDLFSSLMLDDVLCSPNVWLFERSLEHVDYDSELENHWERVLYQGLHHSHSILKRRRERKHERWKDIERWKTCQLRNGWFDGNTNSCWNGFWKRRRIKTRRSAERATSLVESPRGLWSNRRLASQSDPLEKRHVESQSFYIDRWFLPIGVVVTAPAAAPAPAPPLAMAIVVTRGTNVHFNRIDPTQLLDVALPGWLAITGQQA